MLLVTDSRTAGAARPGRSATCRRANCRVTAPPTAPIFRKDAWAWLHVEVWRCRKQEQDERQRQEFDFFINHCRRSHQSVVLAETMYSWLESKGYRVWLDVKMADKSTAAMEYVSVPT